MRWCDVCVATASTSIDSIDVRMMDAVVFVGGPGARTFFSGSTAHRIAREANHAGKIVAAICITEDATPFE
jgi:protease I